MPAFGSVSACVCFYSGGESAGVLAIGGLNSPYEAVVRGNGPPIGQAESRHPGCKPESTMRGAARAHPMVTGVTMIVLPVHSSDRRRASSARHPIATLFSHVHPRSGASRGVSVPASPSDDFCSFVPLSVHGMSYQGNSYIFPVDPAHPYYEGERIPRLPVSVQHPPMACVPGNSAYSHPEQKYDHTMGQDPLAVWHAHLPSSVKTPSVSGEPWEF